MSGVVVVGVDGSPGSVAALEFALHEAARRRAALRVVAAVHPPEYWATPYGPVPVAPSAALVDEVAAAARGWVAGAAARLGVDVPLEFVTAPGAPGRLLLDSCADADLLVVGHRGRGAVGSVLLGSVGLHCVLHAACPVTVVRPVPVPPSEEEREPAATAAASPV